MAYHVGSATALTAGFDTGYGAAGSWVRHLNVGVSIFFVLSGFLLFRPFVLAHLEDRSGPATRPYLVRRLVRIFPAYWLALFVSTQVLDLDLGDWWSHLRYYGLLQIYSGDTVLGGLTQAWSLCTELSFYLFLPLWAALLARVRGSTDRRLLAHYAGCLALFAMALVFRAQLRSGGHAIGYAWLPANTDQFAVGMALAVASAAHSLGLRPLPGVLRAVAELPGAAWLAAFGCYVALVGLEFPYGFEAPTAGQEVLHQVLFCLVAGLVVAPGVVGPQDRGLVRRALRWRPLWALGVISYGIYLWHVTVMDRLHLRMRGPMQADGSHTPAAEIPLFVATVLVTTVIAAASWFLLERPLLTRARARAGPWRVTRRGEDASAHALQSPSEGKPERAPGAGTGGEEQG